MFSRMLGIPILLAAAVGVPYVATNAPDLGGLWKGAKQQVEAGTNYATSVGTLPPAADMAVNEVANVTLQEALRFDISKEWVYGRWARKSTALSGLGLYGIRVALVTGTKLQDVAGSLTYLFGPDGRVQRISFRGRTGDTTQLVALAVKRFGLQQQPTAIVGEQLFQVRRGEQVFSELRTRPASVLRASALNDSFLVNLELQHPEATAPLPSQFLPPPVVAQAEEAAAEVAEASESGDAEKSSGVKGWKAFFPRSRVPDKQVESLDSRGRIW